MIRSLHIKNFQAHADLSLELDPGLNVIVGPSDVGKSSILRAIYWVLTNRPTGDSIRRFNTNETQVKLALSNGHEIVRVRTKSKNEYIIDGKTIKAFGQGVPDEVTQLFPLCPENIQKQIDSFFLLQDSPGSVSSHWNELAGLDKIDSSLSYTNKQLRTITGSVKYQQEQLESLEIELKRFENIDVADACLQEIEELETDIEGKRFDLLKAKEFITKYKGFDKEINRYAFVHEAKGHITEIESLQSVLDKRRGQLTKALDLLHEYGAISSILDRKEYVDMAHALFGDLELLWEGIKERFSALDKLHNIRIKYAKALKRIKEAKKEHNEWVEKFEKKRPKTCPLCGGEWKEM